MPTALQFDMGMLSESLGMSLGVECLESMPHGADGYVTTHARSGNGPTPCGVGPFTVGERGQLDWPWVSHPAGSSGASASSAARAAFAGSIPVSSEPPSSALILSVLTVGST